MIRCIESEGLEALGLAAWMVILQPAAWRLGELAAWMLMAKVRVGMRLLVNDDKDEAWKDFSHAQAWRAPRISQQRLTEHSTILEPSPPKASKSCTSEPSSKEPSLNITWLVQLICRCATNYHKGCGFCKLYRTSCGPAPCK